METPSMEIPEKKQKNPGLADSTIEAWMIWSNEHLGWWRAGRSGYTKDYKEAGKYSLEEATAICEVANGVYFDRDTFSVPNETIHLER